MRKESPKRALVTKFHCCGLHDSFGESPVWISSFRMKGLGCSMFFSTKLSDLHLVCLQANNGDISRPTSAGYIASRGATPRTMLNATHKSSESYRPYEPLHRIYRALHTEYSTGIHDPLLPLHSLGGCLSCPRYTSTTRPQLLDSPT